MPIIGLSILIQILCAVHCVRSRRNGMWLTVIIFLSIPGCLAYAVFEILPQYQGRREVRAVKAVAAKKLDPDRDLRSARDALEMADTAANRTALADALAEKGDWTEAAGAYRDALSRTYGGSDRALQVKLARAELERGDPAAARDILRAVAPSGSPSENDRTSLLLARALDDCGESDAALSLYADVGERLAGAEAQCRHAALLIRLGRQAEAVPLLEETERRARRIDRFERMRDSDMYAWAARTLAELRAP
ncbi:MAG TPA: hypothetical protein VF655_07870 [Allosphingosinicella sp.]|jgi:hypothetical protein